MTLEIRGKCGVCQMEFRRPAAARVPAGYCTACWEGADRHLLERGALAGGQKGEPLGRKHDTEKPRIDLLVEGMPRALEEVSRVLTFGSIKYEDHNWKYVSRAHQRYLAAGMRHELAVAMGEPRDPESGLHHLAHAACCLLFRLELALGKERADDQ